MVYFKYKVVTSYLDYTQEGNVYLMRHVPATNDEQHKCASRKMLAVLLN